MSGPKYLFLDRDGTLIEEPSDFQIDTVEKFRLLPGVIPALIAFKNAGYRFVMVSNQDGLGSKRYPQENFDRIQKLLIGILESQGISFEAVFICPHFAAEICSCRKPKTGLVREYLSSSDWNRKDSYMIGDRVTDLAFAENLGVQGIQINGNERQKGWTEITAEILHRPRIALVRRHTKETQLDVQVNLDCLSAGRIEISTGLPFLDHMLEQLSFHGGFALLLQAKGDWSVDDHHTVEDIGLTLGRALFQALGDKIGVGRYGFYLPMDDASAQAALDLSGRSYFRFEGNWNRDCVGGLSTEMIPHFFKSLSDELKANLHLKIQGENAHHMAESAFKAVGRCLRSAIHRPETEWNSQSFQIPSTKGCL